MNAESVDPCTGAFDRPNLRLIRGGMADPHPTAPSPAIPSQSAPKTKRELLTLWCDNAMRAAVTHRHEARSQLRRSILLGVPVIGLTCASAMMTAVNPTCSVFYVTSVAVAGLGAILAGIQTFLRLDDRRSGSHRAAADYSAIRRRIETMLADNDESPEKIEAIRRDLDNLGATAPLPSAESSRMVAERSAR